MAATQAKIASKFTIEANQQILKNLPFNNKEDFKNAQRGLIAKPDTLTIKTSDGAPVWDLEAYKKYISIDKTAPGTVNPTQLVMQYGLFEVIENIYQTRSYDLSNITFVKGDTGWIVFGPLISKETAAAALIFINGNLGQRPVVGIVYNHSHMITMVVLKV